MNLNVQFNAYIYAHMHEARRSRRQEKRKHPKGGGAKYHVVARDLWLISASPWTGGRAPNIHEVSESIIQRILIRLQDNDHIPIQNTPLACKTATKKLSMSPPDRRGAFIVIEGLDRSGKSTQAAALLARLEGAGVAAKPLKFPG